MRGRRHPPAVAAVDVGTAKVVAAIAVPEADGLRVVGVGRAPAGGVRRGAVVDIEAATAAIATAAERARRVAGRPLPSVTLGCVGGHIVSCNRDAQVHMDPPAEVGSEQVDGLLAELRGTEVPRGYQVVHAIIREYTVDGYEGCVQPVGMAAEHLAVTAHVVACQSTLLRNLWRSALDAGLEIEDFTVAALASAEATLTDPERRRGALVADLGAGATSVAAVLDGEPVGSTVIPLGGRHVTGDIAVGLGIAEDAAEEAKRRQANVAEAPPAPEDPEAAPGPEHCGAIARARVEEILEHVRTFCGDVGLTGRLGAGVVLTGGGSRLRGVSAVAVRILGMPVRCGGALGAAGALAAPEFSALVGLLQLGAQRHTGGRRLPALGAGGRGLWSRMFPRVARL